MKKLYIVVSLFLIMLVTSCQAQKHTLVVSVFDTINYVETTSSSYEEYFLDIKAKLNEISTYTSNFQSNRYGNSIYDLNKNRSVDESPIVKEIINYSLEIKNETNGYFDPFIGKLTMYWKDILNKKDIIDDSKIKSLLNDASTTSVEFKDNKINLIGNGDIDLGAIVKGYALDWVKSYFESKNVKEYYISMGGSSIYTADMKVTANLTRPYNSGYIKSVELLNRGCATSSGENQSIIIDGIRYTHLINPKTGYPNDVFDSVITFGLDNTRNDAYSTAIYSMTLIEATKFINDKSLNVILYKGDKILLGEDLS